MIDSEESCYDHEVLGQSSPDNNSKKMDIVGNTQACIYKKALCEYKSQIIKKECFA